MDKDARKTALRMIPYGLYVLTAEDSDGQVAAATVNWVTQCSFEPPLVAVGLKADSLAHALVARGAAFTINVLAKGQNDLAFTFFKSLDRDGDTIGGQAFASGTSGAPVLDAVPAWLECRPVGSVEKGDHSLFVGEVIEAGLRRQPEGRADNATLWLSDLGEKTYYGG